MKQNLINHFDVWTPWFAWYPVTIGNMRIWWETVDRRLEMWGYDPVWKYRLVGDDDG